MLLRWMDPLLISLALNLEPLVGSVIGYFLGVASAPGVWTYAGGNVPAHISLPFAAFAATMCLCWTHIHVRRCTVGGGVCGKWGMLLMEKRGLCSGVRAIQNKQLSSIRSSMASCVLVHLYWHAVQTLPGVPVSPFPAPDPTPPTLAAHKPPATRISQRFQQTESRFLVPNRRVGGWRRRRPDSLCDGAREYRIKQEGGGGSEGCRQTPTDAGALRDGLA